MSRSQHPSLTDLIVPSSAQESHCPKVKNLRGYKVYSQIYRVNLLFLQEHSLQLLNLPSVNVSLMIIKVESHNYDLER